MDFNAAIDIIIKDLEEARFIIDDFKRYKEVPVIQVELAKSKCKSAAEIIALLKEIPKPGNIPLPVAEQVEKPDDELIVLEKEEPMVPPISEAETEQPKPVAPAKVTETEHPAPVAAAVNKNENAIFADRFKEVKGRVSENVKALNPDEDLTSRIQQSPILNLVEAVGINDKFYFIREVFGGNSNTYNEAIMRLNSVSGLKEAEEIIGKYTSDSSNTKAINQLLALVKRKTGGNE